MYRIIALCGKAGSGKDTILKQILKTSDGIFNPIVSCTTRPPREGEIDSVDYYFISPDEFADKILNGDMLECTVFNDWHYGTLASSLSREKPNIGVFNVAGIACLEADPNVDLTTWCITARDKTRLMRQLIREEDPDVHEIIRRFKADEEDFLDMDFNYIPLENEVEADLEECADRILRWT